MPVTSFIVLNWNGGSAVLHCVRSVLSQQDETVECILVDNGSSDGSLDALKREYPTLKYVENGSNLGFAEGMNRGIRVANGDVIVPLNQDIILDGRFAAESRRVLARDDRIGAVGGIVFQLQNDRRTEQFDAGGYFLARRIAARLYGPPISDADEVFGVSGSCPAFRRSCLEDVALSSGEYFDSEYFAYFEDIDLFFRLQLRGWRVLYARSIRAWHHRSMSTGGKRRFYQKPSWIQRCHFRNRYLTLIKNCPTALVKDLLPGFLISEVVLWPYLLARAPRSITPLLSAWRAVAGGMPRSIVQRRRIQSQRMGSGNHIRQLIRGL